MEDKQIQNDIHSSGYVLESVILNSSRMIQPINMRDVVTDIQIYEHIDRAYLTGEIRFIDSMRVADRLDFQGAESVTIRIKRSLESPVYEKVFIIDKIIDAKKTNKGTEVYTMHMIEEIAFKSNLYNVNKAYTGSPSSIIKKLLEQYLNKELSVRNEDEVQQNIRLIVPNMNVMEAIEWIRDRATTSNGFPFFCFSTLASEKIGYIDLETMLKQSPINENNPLVYSQSNVDTEGVSRLFNIKNYNYRNNENMFSLIDKGLIGSTYYFYDILNSEYHVEKFNVVNDVGKQISELNQRQKHFNVSGDFDFDDLKLQEHDARNIHRIGAVGPYRTRTGGFNSLDETENLTDYRRNVIANAMLNLMQKSHIAIMCDGSQFLAGTDEATPVHFTIGNLVKVLFPGNYTDTDDDMLIDPKKSGDYMIYAAKHTFTLENYHISFECTKLANYNSDIYPTDTTGNQFT